MESAQEKIQAVIDNLESKVEIIKRLQLNEPNLAKEREMNGMADGFEYAIVKLKETLPKPIPTKVLCVAIGAILAGIGLGILLIYLTN